MLMEATRDTTDRSDRIVIRRCRVRSIDDLFPFHFLAMAFGMTSFLVGRNPRCWILWAITIVVPFSGTAPAAEPTVTVGKLTFEFAAAERAGEILAQRDDFISRMSPFDRAVRLGSDQPVSEDQLTRFVRGEAKNWQPAQIDALTEILENLPERLARLNLPNVPKVDLVHTTGREESGAAYTRSSAIVLPAKQLGQPVPNLERLILHELFHVLSRANPDFRDRLYQIIGFTKSSEIQLPRSLRPFRITNPDAPVISHVMKIDLNGQPAWVAPMLYSDSGFDPRKATSMFAYLQFRLMRVQSGDDGKWAAVEVAGKPLMLEPSLPEFTRQIGRNTGYIIHPEEILADNFVELILGNPQVRDPWILEQMAAILLVPAG